MDDRQIRELFKTHEVPLGQSDVWKVQGKTTVIKHSALERLAAKLKISWDAPREVMISMTEVVILARGVRQDGIAEWSYGEVKVVKQDGDGGNYMIKGKQPGYPWAMAEKRAKDRVIIKLAGLHGAYSEEEAEDFAARNQGKGGRQGFDDEPEERQEVSVADSQDSGRSQPDPEPEPEPKPEAKPATGRRGKDLRPKADTKPEPTADSPANDDEPADVKALRKAIAEADAVNAVTDLMLAGDTQELLGRQSDALRTELRDVAKARLVALGWPGKGKAA
jgi:hypothetical protein